MDGSNGLILLIALSISAVNAALAYAAWKHYSLPARIPLVSLVLAAICWLLGVSLQTMSLEPARQLQWARVQYFAAAVTPTLWLLFALRYAGSQLFNTPRSQIILAIEPIISIILVWTSSQHAVRTSQDFLPGGLFGQLVPSPAILSWLHMFYSTALGIAGAILLVRTLLKRQRAYRGITWASVILALVVSTGISLEVLGFNPFQPFPLVPLTIALAGSCLGLAMALTRLLGLIPQACHSLFDHISDSVFILDASNRIIDLNPAACHLINQNVSDVLGMRIDKAWSNWPSEITWPFGKTTVEQEITITGNGIPRSFILRLSPLNNQKDRLRGRVVVLRDVTNQKRAEDALHRRDEILDAIGFATRQFMRRAALEEILPDVFTRLGESTGVSRVYLLENHTTPDGQISSIYRHEWNDWGIQPHPGIPVLQAFSLKKRGLERWADLLSSGQVIIDHLTNLPVSEQNFLKERQVRSLAIIPIFLKKNWWGCLGFEDCKKEREWSQIEIETLKTAADTIGGALQRRQAEGAAHRWADVIQSLLDLTVIIGSTMNVHQVLERVILATQTLLSVDRAAILLWDEQQNALTPAKTTNGDASHPIWPEEAVNKIAQLKLTPELVPLIGELQRHKEAIAIQSVADSPLVPTHLAQLVRIKSLLAVPIYYRDRFTAMLYVDYSRAEHVFTRQEIDLTTALARHAGLAIERARLYTQAQENADELAALYEASSTLFTSGYDLQTLAEQITRVIASEFDFACCSVIWVDKENNQLQQLAQRGFLIKKWAPISLDNPGLAIQAALTGEISYAPDVTKEPHYQPVLTRTQSKIIFPLKAGGEVIALLNLESPELDAFNERTRRMLTAFADDAALALQNVRLINDIQIHARQMALLNEITHTALLAIDIHEKLNIISDKMNELIHADNCYITICEPDRQEVFPGGASKNMLELYHNWSPEPSRPMLTAAVLAAGEPIIVPDANQSNYSLPHWNGQTPFHTLLGLPMIVGDQKLGAVLTGFSQPHAFTKQEISICQQATGQVALAIAEDWSLASARQAAEKRTILHRVSQEIVTASIEPEKIYAAIHRAAQQLMPTEAFAITLVTPDLAQAEAVYLIDKEGRTSNKLHPTDQELTGRVLKAGKTISIPDVDRVADLHGLHFGGEEHTRSVLAVPLRVGDRVIGILSAQSYQPNAYTTESQYLLEMLAATATIAIENSRLLKEIQWLAITDPLTGLYNRRGLFELAEREVDRYKRFKRPFCVIMLDIDHFKVINDTHGHASGDQVLVELARRLKTQIRDIDIIGRYGGEEILVVLPETLLAQSLQAAERARNTVQRTPFKTDRGEIPVTISAGVAQFDVSISDLASLVDRADSAMYSAKQAGRNRVEAYTEAK